MDKSKYKSLGTSYWYVTLVVVILAGAAAVTYAIITTSNSIKASLIQRTDSMAELIPPDSIAKLNGDESDLQLPEYQELKDDLMAIRESNRDIRFIYILSLRNSSNEAYFAIDSERPGSEGYSPPGQAYPEGLKDVRAIYEQKTSRVLPIERDRWGIWLSAFSQIFDADKEHVVGVFGMDVPAGYYYRQIAITAAVPLLLTLIIGWV